MQKFVVLLVLAACVYGAEGVSFHKDVRPLLEQRCAACHQAGRGAAGVSLNSFSGVKAALQRLVPAVSGSSPRMPKSGPPLTAAEVALLEKWIGAGAVDDTPAGFNGSVWWSLAPLSAARPPAISSPWIRTPIDAFIIAKLQEKGLTPSPEADRRTLIRRLTFDLHGLPPTYEETQAFLADKAPDAYEKLVDRLLASPRYGERWGRHWLDVVHYGESHGYDKDKPRRNAWPYRDYVIRSFNSDKPYARFVEEQLAGDVLFPDDPQGVVATGFIAAGPWDFVGHAELREGTTDKENTRLLDRDDMLMTTMSAFSSMTAHCARCHNHKFDPIPQEDYYSLQAVFAGVDRAERPYDEDPAIYAKRRVLLEERRAIMVDLQPLWDKAAAVSTPEIQELDKQLRIWRNEKAADKLAAGNSRRRELVRAQLDNPTLASTDRLDGLLADVDKRIASLPKPQMVYAAANIFPLGGTLRWPIKPRPIHVLGRGSVQSPGKEAHPGALSAVPRLAARFDGTENGPEGARRAALAHWITDRNNMLTWRSIANRIWHYHFGAGLVDSPNDFGRMGSLPSHPELLDWLAVQFRDNGGRMKQLHRQILLSAVYRQDSAADAAKARLDAGNRFLWRMNRWRLDAESVRDATLQAAGRLDLQMGGPSAEQFFFKDDHSPVYDYTRFDIDSPGSRRRSVYRFIVRSVPDPLMERLDCPDPSTMTAKRNTTITAIQALALMNNPLLVKQAEYLAARAREAGPGQTEQIQALYRLTLQRDPSASEAGILARYAAQHGLENASRLLLNSNEFLFVD
ncbi:MAG TPA: DUF1549 and DUF1553 domain-containing protein [Bryobacteraceae bacterium]|nr:DUF1549 and DUF1553 domain-containing protein [Bryobacteraceae bacterium]